MAPCEGFSCGGSAPTARSSRAVGTSRAPAAARRSAASAGGSTRRPDQQVVCGQRQELRRIVAQRDLAEQPGGGSRGTRGEPLVAELARQPLELIGQDALDQL